jgi:hypothetical protein
MKKNNCFITLLLILFASTTFGMEPENNNNKGWLTITANALLHGTKALEFFLQQDVNFEDLPQEEQAETFFFLTKNHIAETLDEASSAISSLTKVNKQLDTLVNSPIFCLQLIKRLAQRFTCSDEIATQALPITEAKHRLTIQKEFKTIFEQAFFDVEEFDKLYSQHKNYVDLNFTYQHSNHTRYDDKNTLLINSAMYPSPYKTVKIESLLKTKKININYQNTYGETALIACAYNCDNPQALQILCKAPDILIDLQDNYGNTALMSTCLSTQNKHLQSGCIFILLYAGADPKIANKEGKTPLAISKDVKRIQDTIQKSRNQREQATERKKETRTKKSSSKK